MITTPIQPENVLPDSTLQRVAVMIGFSPEQLNHLQDNKLLSSVAYPCRLADFESNSAILMEIMSKLSEKQTYYWCTMEEYQFYLKNNFTSYFDFSFILNNLYYRTFPLYYEVDDINQYINLFSNDDENIPEELEEGFEFITSQYCSIIDCVRPYVSYATTDEIFDEWIPYYSIEESNEIEFTENESYPTIIELSEDESLFLQLCDDTLHGRLDGAYRIDMTSELTAYSNEYLNRIGLLNAMSDTCTFYLSRKKLHTHTIDETPYLHYLNKYWGYPAFRSLQMYKDPDQSKELVTVSQSQIIDDIVTNAVQSHEEKPFRDIFITSPTGAGKSIMFQIPSLYLYEKYGLLTIVISPLIGLMKDQVDSVKSKGIRSVETINSDITPMEKAEITERIQAGEISTLYISPETLLSRSDIKMLIGEQRVGLFIVDEAHIVTTWGKAFRADYWYLGTYLQKLRKEMKFPIATFTATAIYGGEEDMYKETRDSLALLNPITYLGNVKREDINIKLNSKDTDFKGNEYLKAKFMITAERVKRFIKQDEKTLIYFPTINLILKFNQYMEENHPRASEKMTTYYGRLKKEEKHANAQNFKNGDLPIMLATKAFGMGIDIPDIVNVYHFAPTGNVCDYVQEVGRAARDESIEGSAIFDFLSNDFSHVKRLHGMSMIRKYQLQLVAKKILSLYKEKRNRSRNLLVSAEDFRYIFEDNSRVDIDGDIDGKLKTALLLLEKDFAARMGYSPFVARPRGMFSKEFFRVKPEGEKILKLKKNSKVGKLLKQLNDDSIYSAIYMIDLKVIWERDYRNLSFAQFKYYFHINEASINLPLLNYIDPIVELTFSSKCSKEMLSNKTKNIINILEEFLRNKAMNKSYFQLSEFASYLQTSLKKDKYVCEGIAQVVLQSMQRYGKMIGHMDANNVAKAHETRGYMILPGYQDFIKFVTSTLDNYLHNPNLTWDEKNRTGSLYLPKTLQASSNERTSILFGLLEALDLVSYQLVGGSNPEIYIRINSVLELERLAKHPESYKNHILSSVHTRHRLSVAMLTYIFKSKMSTEEFWTTIEDYFLGKVPDEVIHEAEKLNKKAADTI